MLFLNLLNSSTPAYNNSKECEPGPYKFIPKRPESVKWLPITLAESTKLFFYIKLVTARQYIPLPGPPELNDVALPIKVRITKNAI